VRDDFLPETLRRWLRGRPEPEATSDAANAAYDTVMDRAFDSVLREVPAALREADLVEQAYAVLVAEGLDGLERAADGRRFRGPPLCLALLRRSLDMRRRDPDEMLKLATLAAESARELRPEEWGEHRAADLCARTSAELANARRLAGDLVRADEDMRRAFDHFAQGSRDPLLSARLLALRATLLCDHRRFAEAQDLLERAEAIYKDFGEGGEATRILVKRGLYAGYAGQVERAIGLLSAAVAVIDERAEPELALDAAHSLAVFLMDSGDWRQAAALVSQFRRLYERHGQRIVLIKKTWLEGRVEAARGRLDQGAAALEAAIAELEEVGLGYEAAIAGLDLAAVQLRLGRTQAAVRLIGRSAETFVALGIGREALAAVVMLRDAVEQETASEGIVQEVARFVRRLQHDPG
jgi:tetratricopeptide (TPR) repeat protein